VIQDSDPVKQQTISNAKSRYLSEVQQARATKDQFLEQQQIQNEADAQREKDKREAQRSAAVETQQAQL
jgi:hypothetical protein